MVIADKNMKSEKTQQETFHLIDKEPAKGGEELSQEEWFEYYKKENKVMASLPEIYHTFKVLGLMIEQGTETEKKEAETHLDDLCDALYLNSVVTSTTVIPIPVDEGGNDYRDKRTLVGRGGRPYINFCLEDYVVVHHFNYLQDPSNLELEKLFKQKRINQIVEDSNEAAYAKRYGVPLSNIYKKLFKDESLNSRLADALFDTKDYPLTILHNLKFVGDRIIKRISDEKLKRSGYSYEPAKMDYENAIKKGSLTTVTLVKSMWKTCEIDGYGNWFNFKMHTPEVMPVHLNFDWSTDDLQYRFLIRCCTTPRAVGRSYSLKPLKFKLVQVPCL